MHISKDEFAAERGATPLLSTDQGYVSVCLTCGSIRSSSVTGYCFDCHTDNWDRTNIPVTSQNIEDYEHIGAPNTHIKSRNDD